MNELGIALMWVVLQVSLLALVSSGVYLLVRRGTPVAGSAATTAGLSMVIVVSLLALLPWSGWSWKWLTPPDGGVATPPRSVLAQLSMSGDTPVDGAPEIAPGMAPVTPERQLESPMKAFADGFVAELRKPMRPGDESLRWPGWLALMVLSCAAIGFLRVVTGLVWVGRCRSSSVPIGDREIRDSLDVIRAEAQCPRSIELQSSPEVASAATVGWWRPVILLPENWRDWSPAERRSVLAHEVAHVAHRDSLYWMLAQIGLLLHFYHPLVHWLTGRLRLEQELAADESAARIVGDRRQYLTTLAELAVRQPDRPLAWPARTFVPTRGTLLRRIDMLRSTKWSESTGTSTGRRVAAVSITVIVGFVLAGLRPPQSQQALAQGESTLREAATTNAADMFDVRYVPPGVAMLVGARPAAVAELEALRPITPQINQLLAQSGLSVADVSQVLMMFRTSGEKRPVEPPIFEIRTHRSHNFSKLITQTIGETEERTTDGGISYQHARAGSDLACYLPNDRTILLGEDEEIAFAIDSTKSGPVLPSWRQEFVHVASGHFFFLTDLDMLRPVVERELSESDSPVAGMLQPLWKDTHLLLGGGTLTSPTALKVTAWCDSADGAQRVQKTIDSLVTLGENLLNQRRTKLGHLPAEAQGSMSILIGQAEDILETCQTEQVGAQVTASFETEQETVPVMVGLLLPAVQAAREAARRTQSRNNLHVLGIALHNYYHEHGTFPPPAVTGSDGETTHSWRVAILPYLDEHDLYDEYNFSQPWDSEQNKKVLASMPAVFRNPNDAATSKNTSYFAVVGENTGFGNRDEGTKMQMFRDGTSNTALLVEAKREIPWTKPEDIPFDNDDDVPELGGWRKAGFLVGLADGSALLISDSIDEDALKNLILRNDGNQIDFSNIRR